MFQFADQLGLVHHAIDQPNNQPCFTKVRVLQGHVATVDEQMQGAAVKANTPMSEVDAPSFQDFVEHAKAPLNEIEVDIRDAKRRINLAKGPKKRKTEQPAENDASNDDDDDASGDD